MYLIPAMFIIHLECSRSTCSPQSSIGLPLERDADKCWMEMSDKRCHNR